MRVGVIRWEEEVDAWNKRELDLEIVREPGLEIVREFADRALFELCEEERGSEKVRVVELVLAIWRCVLRII